MSTFFENHKRKGVLSLLLLLLGRGKGVVPLLILVVVLSGLSVLPFGFRAPAWLDRILLGKIGQGAYGPGLSQEMSANRGMERSLGRRLLGAILPRRFDQSSVDFVRGKGLVDTKFAGKVSIKGGKSISGVIRPEDLGKMKDGISLTTEELLAGLVNSAQAGDFAAQLGRVGGVKGLEALMAGKLPYYGKEPVRKGAADFADGGLHAGGGGLSGGRAVNVELRTVAAGGSVLRNGRNFSGKMSGKFDEQNQGRLSQLNQNRMIGSEKEMGYLAQTNAFSQFGSKCAGDISCPKEHASTTSDAPFSGVKPDGDIVLQDADPVALVDGAALGGFLLAAESSFSNFEQCIGAVHATSERQGDLTNTYISSCQNAMAVLQSCTTSCMGRCNGFTGFMRRLIGQCRNNCSSTCRARANAIWQPPYQALRNEVSSTNNAMDSECQAMRTNTWNVSTNVIGPCM